MPNAASQQLALERVIRDATAQPERMLKQYSNLKRSNGFEEWLEPAIKWGWMSHTAMWDGLFDKTFTDIIAPIINCQVKDLEYIWQLSRDDRNTNEWAKQSGKSEASRIAIDAYLASAMIRGLYHVEQSKNNWHLIQHPAREAFITPGVSNKEYSPTKPEIMISCIIVSSAMTNIKHEERILVWAENVTKSQNYLRSHKNALDFAASESEALQKAVEFAKRADLRTHPVMIEKWLELLVPAAFSALALVLCHWAELPTILGSPVGPAVQFGTRQASGTSSGPLVANLLYRTTRRLRSLATEIPGSIRNAMSARP